MRESEKGWQWSELDIHLNLMITVISSSIVLQQESVRMIVLYTGSIGSGSQA